MVVFMYVYYYAIVYLCIMYILYVVHEKNVPKISKCGEG